MENAEIASSLRKALENIEKASRTYTNRKEDELDHSLWRAFTEIEYTSFLVSSETGNNEIVERTRRRVSRIDMKSSLIDARDSLLKSLKLVEGKGLSNKVSDEVEEAKASVFDTIRKLSAKNRKKKNRGS